MFEDQIIVSTVIAPVILTQNTSSIIYTVEFDSTYTTLVTTHEYL
jgi:hypothetical protein